MKKVLLINPPVFYLCEQDRLYSLAFAGLGKLLERNSRGGFRLFLRSCRSTTSCSNRVFFLDHSDFYQQSGDLILEKKPDLLLFTVHGLNHIVVLKLSERVKNERPSCVIVVGGVGPTLSAHEALGRCEHIDIIVKGEGEPVLKHLIPAVFGHGNFSEVPSIVYREDGRVIENTRCYLDKRRIDPFPRLFVGAN